MATEDTVLQAKALIAAALIQSDVNVTGAELDTMDTKNACDEGSPRS